MVKRFLIGAALTALVPLPVLGSTTAARAADQPTYAHRVVAVKLVDRGDYPAGATDAAMLARLNATLDFWTDQTDGRVTFERPGAVVELRSNESCDDSRAMRAQVEAMFPTMKFTAQGGDHYVLIMPGSCRTKGSAGSIGTGLASGGYVVGSYDTSAAQGMTWAHELGHNLGLDHAWAQWCDGPCTPSEYSDRYSTMGVTMSGAADTPRALSSYERVRLGLASADEVRSLVLEQGRRVRSFEVSLRGRGTASGLRGLAITDPVDGRSFSLDFRNGLGDDAGAYVARAQAQRNSYYYNKGVTVQEVSTDPDGDRFSLLQAFTQQAVPGWHYGLVEGETFTSSSGGIKVEVVGLQLTGSTEDVATLRVTLTNPSVPLGTQAGTIAIDERGAVGSTVSASTAGWEDASLGSISWYADGVALDGVTGPTITIPDGLDGKTLTARVTGTRESYLDRTATSNPLVVGRGLLVSGATYEFRSLASGQLVSGDGPRDTRDNVQAQLVTASAPSTRWVVTEVATGVYTLKNVGTGRCLDNERALTTAGNPIILWSCPKEAATNQSWTVTGNGQGYALVNQKSKLALAPQASGLLVQSGTPHAFTLNRVG